MNEALMQDALKLRRAGRLLEAAELYSQILRDEPRHFEALHGLGILRFQAGKLDEAERLIGEAVLVNPQASEAFYNRGSLLLKLNRPEEALNAFAAALAIKPDYAKAMGNRGSALMQLGRYGEALADFAELVRLRPQLPEAWLNHASALLKLTRYEEAHASYERALKLRPEDAEARKKRGAIALILGRFMDALSDAQDGLARNSSDASFWALRANALAELNRREEAAASYDRTLSLQPAHADVLYNRANNLLALRRYEEAAQGYEQTLRIAPDYPYAQGAKAFSKLCGCDWQYLDAETAAAEKCLHQEIAVAPYHVLVLSPRPADAFAAARLLSTQKYPSSATPLWSGEIYRHGKIRLAYISANFHDHAVSRLIAGMIEHHDRERFEISAVSLGPSDAGAMRTRLVKAFDRFIDVRQDDAAGVARRLRQMETDIAIDLMGFTEGCRPDILRHRLAPIQVNYLGYPGTLGADYVDYIVADPVVLPEKNFGDYSENVVHLPHCYLPGGGMRAIAERAPSRSQAGLPENGFVFCCFNHAYKITPELFDIWMRLLRQVDNSVLWLSPSSASAMGNLRREAVSRGVHPDRLVFAPFVKQDEDHLARLTLADVFLDTLPYNAHATACDALWAGVPVLSAMGEGFPGRVGASLLRAIGLEEMIAPSLALYESMAAQLTQDEARLSTIKAKLARNREQCPLFDTARFTRDLERAYISMWDRSQRGLAPERFAVGSLA